MWIRNQQRRIRIDIRFLRRVATRTLAAVASRGAECSLLLIGDARMAALNQAYRGIAHPTDVLAFPAKAAGKPAEGPGEPATRPADKPAGEAPPAPAPAAAPEGAAYLGDVAISLETARRQAARRGHPLEREAALLVIHGILHLAGYDHRTPAQRRRMWRLQARLLRAHAGAVPRGAGRRRGRP